MTAILVPAAVTLRDQVNHRFPKRKKDSDGWIGDSAHADRISDHNPDHDGWVHGLDLDHDFGAVGDHERFLTQLLAYCRAGHDFGRIKYVTHRGRIASGTYPGQAWRWRPTTDTTHDGHIHISFTHRAEHDGSPFNLPILRAP